MPYNTTAIPPRKEVTGQTQLPLSRVKKIVAQDQDIGICSNNAAFVITLATEMFIQYLAGESFTMAKLGKPRRNIQYKDLAAAVSHQDNLEFLEDVIPKTAPYKQIKAQAAATRNQLSSGTPGIERVGDKQREVPATNGGGSAKKHRPSTSRSSLNGGSFVGASGARIMSDDDGAEMDPADQLHHEMRQANQEEDEDVQMSG
ncbi:putative transcription factor C16C4.22 [Daldinia childiae]|uniref:putative transcription factor C16C4.22 n=1 Tax=Daldinia childiae TaxID=326645 RepID=UPI0014482713|nr:putative transcription factor C16C4.22 [Daldinia childiae]KAF3061374.1 putative transcription factor C16C4.22 [Daldinia childiae]